MAPTTKEQLVLITGGYGFIGSHVAHRLHRDGFKTRIVDISQCRPTGLNLTDDFIHGNLCDGTVCAKAVHGVHTVMHFAANMGGMGTIHSENDSIIYAENHAMTQNLLKACVDAGVLRFFYASSACVYSDSLQQDPSLDVSLRESDAWADVPPTPQGLYGTEKLVSEVLLHQYRPHLDIRIARFHNVYGPRGAWRNGREKAPAAFVRKAIAAKLAGTMEFEIWGDGCQRRSFLWIDDAVEGIVLLLQSDAASAAPVNIGSDTSVTIRELADIALRSVGVDSRGVRFHFDETRPVGVVSRNSNNDLVKRLLGWAPVVSLHEGMSRLAQWMKGEVAEMMDGLSDDDARRALLCSLKESKIVHLDSETIVFGLLVPITSRGAASPGDCLKNLARFAQSVVRTTWRDTQALGGQRYAFKVYLVVDDDDAFLWEGGGGTKAEAVLRREGVVDVVVLRGTAPKGHVCELWRESARRAYRDGCAYIVLLGDDVVLLDEGWMRDVHAEFADMAVKENVPPGFGCVAFTDESFHGMPTFPILHRTHLDIFDGVVVPDDFVNQDGDPYLYQLYRRWNCSRMFSSRVSNGLGGSDSARYEKQHATNWTFGPLDTGVVTAQKWLCAQGSRTVAKITLDVIVPCYRVQIPILDGILTLQPSEECTVMFIIIIDDPASPHIPALLHKYDRSPNVRIRVNEHNVGASASRNRGLEESAADWVHFLDDDIVPAPNLLVEAERAIRGHPTAAGFVGTALFPPADTVAKTAIHLAGVTYFWDIARKMAEDLPWGVTANLVARRSADGVRYDTTFPKTGGGEDIHFCRQKRAFALQQPGGVGFMAASDVVVTHPWWHGGKRSWWRFYMWSVGDGALVKLYPEHTYRDFAPNSSEMLLFAVASAPVAFCSGVWQLTPLKIALAVVVSNIVHDCYRHLWRDVDRTLTIGSTLTGTRWFLAVIESSLIRMASEAGRTRGILARGEWSCLGRRFDWFTGRAGDGPKNEQRKDNVQKLVLVAVVGWMLGAVPCLSV
ncbi:glycosyltransferase family 2 protein [Plicaturopsis crispa FD-325 SS-3]|nr:glycosyltransferase family 2 protein [Plicaturopsis crispa FD-325 SS-3]